MFSKIWHGSIIAAIVMYSGNIFFATEPCDRVERSGSVVRMAASGIFFLSDNWMSVKDRASVRKQANKMDIGLQHIVTTTFFGNSLRCDAGNSVKSPILKPAKLKTTSTTTNDIDSQDVPEIINENPFNLPSLPDEIKK